MIEVAKGKREMKKLLSMILVFVLMFSTLPSLFANHDFKKQKAL